MGSAIVAIYFFITIHLRVEWNSIVSDDYSPYGMFIVMQAPYDIITHFGSVLTLDPVGSYHVVKNGMALYFSRETGYLETGEHLPKERYKYLAVQDVAIPKNTKFNLLTNNCKQFKI